jgi:hypothetical protein
MNHEKIKLKCIELAYEQGEDDAIVLARAQKYFEFVTYDTTDIAGEGIDNLQDSPIGYGVEKFLFDSLLDNCSLRKIFNESHAEKIEAFSNPFYKNLIDVVIYKNDKYFYFSWLEGKPLKQQETSTKEQIRKLLA